MRRTHMSGSWSEGSRSWSNRVDSPASLRCAGNTMLPEAVSLDSAHLVTEFHGSFVQPSSARLCEPVRRAKWPSTGRGVRHPVEGTRRHRSVDSCRLVPAGPGPAPTGAQSLIGLRRSIIANSSGRSGPSPLVSAGGGWMMSAPVRASVSAHMYSCAAITTRVGGSMSG